MEGDRFVKTGCWDSIHVVEATENDSKTSATYKLTTTVMLHMGVDKVELGDTLLSGSLTRQVRVVRMITFSQVLWRILVLRCRHILYLQPS